MCVDNASNDHSTAIVLQCHQVKYLCDIDAHNIIIVIQINDYRKGLQTRPPFSKARYTSSASGVLEMFYTKISQYISRAIFL